MYLSYRHLHSALALGLLLSLAACDAGVDASEELAPPSGSLAAPNSPALLASPDSIQLPLRLWLEELEREARRAGLQIDPSGYIQLAKGGQIVAGVPVALAKPPSQAQRRRGIPVLVIALADPIDMQQPQLFFVRGKQKGSRKPTLSIFDPSGRRVRSTSVATAVGSLLGLCIRPSTAEGTLEAVCGAAGGTVKEECDECFWFFTCCEQYCAPA